MGQYLEPPYLAYQGLTHQHYFQTQCLGLPFLCKVFLSGKHKFHNDPLCLFVCLLMWWAGDCSITESLPELIQKVRQDLAGAPGAEFYIIYQRAVALLS